MPSIYLLLTIFLHYRSDWDKEKSDDLKAMLGTIFSSWIDTTGAALSKVFQSDDDSLNRLGNLINAGKMLGNQTNGAQTLENVENDYREYFGNMMFATAAPLAWRMSNNLAFIVDMETKCDAKFIDFQKNRIDENSFAGSQACVGGQLYYLAMVPEGKTENCPIPLGHSDCSLGRVGEGCVKGGSCTQNMFAHPPGIERLDGKYSIYANIAAADIIKG